MAKCAICYDEVEHAQDHWAYESMDVQLRSPANQIVVGALWREAKRRGMENVFLAVWRRKRAEKQRMDTLWQVNWRTKVSRRPQRGRHHDSWSIREKYARCA
jgi:hypothetical protein